MDHAAKTPPSGSAIPERDLTGRTLADFRILRRLGQGGMGQVYLAEQLSLKRKVALKILRPDLADNPTALQRFKAEAEHVAQATHANIVQVYAIGEADGISYMALEYVEGKNLREYLAKKGPPEVVLALSIMRQVAAALQRAGELGIVHRDIKPENILLTRKGEVKVADFGLAPGLTGDRPLNLTQSGVTMGTPLYMSPEQVEGKSLDPRSDIYSFGVTCFDMLAGRPPFRGETAFEVALQHVKDAPPSLAGIRPDLPPALCAIVHKMMAKSPTQRYQTGRDLLKDIARLREGLSGQAPRPVTGEVQPQRPSQTSPTMPLAAVGRRRWLAVLFAVSVVLAVAVGVGLAMLRRHREAQLPPAPAGSKPEADFPFPTLQKHEATLAKKIEPYFDPGSGLTTQPPYKESLELGLLYLNQDRLDDADKHFTRLDNLKFPKYHALGHLGRAIVLALRSKPAESNQLFKDLDPQRLAGRRFDPKSPDLDIRQTWTNPQFRFWISEAIRYNVRNAAEADVPKWVLELRDPPAQP
jgi:serine/threonine-protein kinase